jgi:hypothetical protein
VAIALAHALQTAPPRNVVPELVLQGAGEGQELGMRRYLRHRHRDAIVLGIAASGAGQPHYWRSDGRLIPLPYPRRLRDLASDALRDSAKPHRGRGATPASPAQAEGLAATAIGALDSPGLAPRSHQASDTPDRINPETLNQLIEVGLRLVAAIDDGLEPEPMTTETTTTPA